MKREREKKMRQKNQYVQRPGEEMGPGPYEELCGELGGWRVVTKRDEAQDVVKNGPLPHRATATQATAQSGPTSLAMT